LFERGVEGKRSLFMGNQYTHYDMIFLYPSKEE
jgi:hypothetical protein